MRHLELVPILLFSLGCTQTAYPPNAIGNQKTINNPQHVACETDQNCTLISESCCGCNQGGKQVSVNTKYAREIETSRVEICAEIMCMQVISTDPSCEWTQAICIDNKCSAR